MIVSTINAGTSIFAGFVTFALIGSIAHETNRPVTELVESGKHMYFVSFFHKMKILILSYLYLRSTALFQFVQLWKCCVKITHFRGSLDNEKILLGSTALIRLTGSASLRVGRTMIL